MEKSEYHSIREDVNNHKGFHNKMVGLLEAIREKTMEDAYFPIKEGIATSPRLYKEYVLTEKKIGILEEYDSGLELNMLSNRDNQLAKAVSN